MVFEMTPETAMEFYRRSEERNATTESARMKILCEMAAEGLVQRVSQTNRTPDQYVADLAKNFEVADLRHAMFDPEKTLDAVWCKDSETGEDVLIDRLTNRVIMRGKP